ncbi:MAG: NAD(P)H-quinone oxidoreductase [Acidobacteria bacterium]|nr:MAG: NAD(P)H-quinone oxidoreductase [Acidobacteriota bacterium]
MKAVVISRHGPPEVLRVEEIDDPVCGSSQVRVAAKATALNRADLLQRIGRYPAPKGVDPRVPGLEFAGAVEETGQAVSEWQPGDRVMGLLSGGGYAEKVVTEERMLLRIPDSLDFEEAAAVPEVFGTAYDALFSQLQMAMGERLLIHAVASGVGLTALQLAKTAGCFVFGTAGSQEKLDRARELGLDVGINYRESDFAKMVAQKTGNQGVDAIIDLVGGGYWEKNLASLAMRGRLILVGLLSGAKAETNLALILNKRLTIIGTVLRSRPVEEKIALTQSLGRHVLPLLETRRVRPVIDRIFPLADAAQAHAYMESNANVGKIVLRV